MSLMDQLKKLAGQKPVMFAHPERQLAAEFGLAHEIVKAARVEHLKRGLDWELVKGLLCYTDAAREKIRSILKIAGPPAVATATLPPPPDSVPNDGPADEFPGTLTDLAETPAAPPPPPPPKKYVPPKPGEQRVLTCVATVRNKRIVRAKDGDREAWVRVRNSKNFRPGMAIPAAFVAGEQWDFVGRLPRWPGKF